MARILVLGGIPQSLVNFRRKLLEKMVAEKHEVFVCAPKANTATKNILNEMGVIYHEIYLARTSLNPIKDIKSLLGLIRLFKKIKPDVFLGYTIKPVIYGSFAAKLAGVNQIYSMIEGLGYAFTGAGIKRKVVGYLAKFLYRRALKYQNKVFFLNPDDFAEFTNLQLIRDPQQGVLLNGIGVDLDVFLPASYPEKLSFLLIGRLVRDKGVNEYYDAARIIKQEYPYAVFELAGFIDKNPTAISEKKLRQWDKSGIVKYIGQLTNEEVLKAIAASSVYVLPSYREGLPVTVMEAMAMARPIITTDVPGCRETVRQGKNGFLVPVKSVKDLVKSMKYFLDNPQQVERMGRESRTIAEDKYDVHKVNAVIFKAMGLAQ